MDLADMAGRRVDTVVRGRATAESVMTLTVQALRPDPDDVGPGKFRDAEPVPYGDPVRARVGGSERPEGREESSGGATRVVMTPTLHLPVTAFIGAEGLEISEGWLFKVTAVGAADDPALLGVTYEVLEVQRKSNSTARRLDVREV